MNLDRLTIKLPWLDSRLLPNNRNGKAWQSTKQAKKSAREAGKYATLEALGRHTLTPSETHPLAITFAAKDGKHGDLDNMLAAMKSTLDGVADALGVNDKRFRPITIDVVRDSEKKGFVIVEIG